MASKTKSSSGQKKAPAKQQSKSGGQSSAQIAQKNLTMLQEQMAKEALLYKKCNVSAAQFDDAKLKSLAQKIAMHHKQRFDALYSYLNTH